MMAAAAIGVVCLLVPAVQASAAQAATGPDSVATVAASTVVPAAPSGCPTEAFCVYQRGNGGGLCGIFYGNSSDWGPGCANNEDSVFNNGTPCNGCQDVNIYWGSNYTGAYYCLPMGHYLLYMTQNVFNRTQSGPGGSDGYNQVMAYNAVSNKWTRC